MLPRRYNHKDDLCQMRKRTSFYPKIALLIDIFVMLKIISSEYQSYTCGKIFRMP